MRTEDMERRSGVAPYLIQPISGDHQSIPGVTIVSKFARNIRVSLFAIGLVALCGAALADNSQTQMPLPRIERGQLVSPMPTPTPSPNANYPRLEDGRVQVNKDVSVGGTLSPP